MDFNCREVEPPVNVYLSSLGETIRCELKDSEARLNQSKCEGRVHLEIRQDSLANFLGQLREQKEAQLDEAQTKHVHSRHKDVECLKSELGNVCSMLRKAQKDLSQQLCNTKALHAKFEQMKGEKEALQNEVEVKKLEVRNERRLIAVAKTNVELELESYLETEKAQAQKLQNELSKMEGALRKQKDEAKKSQERSQASHQAQLEEQRAETRKVLAALKKAEGLLETERLHFQQEKNTILEETEKSRASYVAQQDEQKQKNKTLVAALLLFLVGQPKQYTTVL